MEFKWPEVIYQWRLQNIVNIGIEFITSIDHDKSRSDLTEHTKQNNKDLTPGLGGQFTAANLVNRSKSF
jgi:hypothetical protein